MAGDGGIGIGDDIVDANGTGPRDGNTGLAARDGSAARDDRHQRLRAVVRVHRDGLTRHIVDVSRQQRRVVDLCRDAEGIPFGPDVIHRDRSPQRHTDAGLAKAKGRRRRDDDGVDPGLAG